MSTTHRLVTTEYDYDPATDCIVITDHWFEDGGRTERSETRREAVAEADEDDLRDAIEMLDYDLFETIDEDDTVDDLRIFFRSMFVELNGQAWLGHTESQETDR